MSVSTPVEDLADVPDEVKPKTKAAKTREKLRSPWASAFAIVLAILWTIPTFGVALSSFRPEDDIKSSGWWTFFKNPGLTLENYKEVIFGTGDVAKPLGPFFVNSFVITFPAVTLSIGVAAMCAYALACTKWKGRDIIFIGIFAMQIVPLQMALVPLLQRFVGLGMAGTYLPVWIAHAAFGMPLCVFLLHNFMSDLPESLFEAARVDGAGHATIFARIVLPLCIPALAALLIFQFLFIWNDLLVGLTFAGGTPDVAPLTVRLAELAGTRGNEWQRLTAGAMVGIVVPLIVFLSLQRYFIRGLLAGGLKG